MHHADAIKKLMPLDLGGNDTRDIAIDGAMLDSAYYQIIAMQNEMFPSSADKMLDVWEYEYGITPADGATLADRRLAVIAQHMMTGDLARSFFINLARQSGFDIEIVESGENFKPFRAGISRAGDRLEMIHVLWHVEIKTSNAPPSTALENLFRDLFPPHVLLSFNYD